MSLLSHHQYDGGLEVEKKNQQQPCGSPPHKDPPARFDAFGVPTTHSTLSSTPAEEVHDDKPGDDTTTTTKMVMQGKDNNNNEPNAVLALMRADHHHHHTNDPTDDCPTDDATSDDGPEQHQPTFQKNYAISEKISKGNYGVVYRAIHRSTSLEYAVKVICRGSLAKLLEGDAMVEREIDLLQACRDIENVVKIIEYYRTPRYFYIVQNYAPGGDVFTRLALRTSYTEKNARDLARQLLQIIEALHRRRIVHRDLKPENLLLRDDFDDSAIILADFGFARYLPENGKLTTRCGTPAFAAPELIRPSCRCDEKVDTWAFGCLLYMLLGGYPPFRDTTLASLYRKIRVADYVFHAKVWDEVSVAAKRLISGLLTVNPADRVSAAEALDNPWISTSDAILDKKKLTASLGEIKKFHQRRSLDKNAQRSSLGKMVKSTGDLTEIDTDLVDDSCYTGDNHNHNDPRRRWSASREKSDTILAILPSVEFHDFFEMGSQIYAFQSNKVYKCKDKRTRQRLGVRVVERNMGEEKDVACKTISEMLFNEIAILDSLHHRSIERIFHVYEDENRFYLTTEIFCGKDVFDQLQMFGTYEEDDARLLAWILIDAVAHMHSQGIVHRDLKPQHLLLRRRESNYDIILSGFGCACRVHEPQSLTGRFGTPSYVAPEVLKNIPYDQAVDMWSIGVILYTLLSGKRPFEDADQTELFRKIRCGKWKFQGSVWRTISPNAKALIVELLEVNPAKRLTAIAALQSPWFAGKELLRRNKSVEAELANDPDLIIEATEVNPCIAGEFTRSLARFGSIQL